MLTDTRQTLAHRLSMPRALRMLAVAIPFAAITPASAGQIAYYDFEISSISGGALVNQQNPGDSDGAMTDVTTGHAGVFGEAFGFPEIGSLNLGSGSVTSQISGTNPWSISAWIQPGDLGFAHILYRRDAAFDGDDSEGGLRIAVGGAPQVSYQDVASNSGNLTAPVVLDIGEWAHVVGIREPAPGSDLRIYINGVEYAGAADPFSIASASVAEIGVDFTGLLDEMRVYDHALSNEEVQALYQAGLAAQVPAPGALALFGLGLAALGLARRRRAA